PFPLAHPHPAQVDLPLVVSFHPPVKPEILAELALHTYKRHYQVVAPVNVVSVKDCVGLGDRVFDFAHALTAVQHHFKGCNNKKGRVSSGSRRRRGRLVETWAPWRHI